MTKRLNRGNVFVVLRDDTRGTYGPAVVGVFYNLEDADDYKGMCEQQWIDKVGSLDGVEFDIQLTTFYG